MPLETIRWNERGWIELIDQTLLPNELKYIACRTVEEVWEAIKTLRVRGAPAIGIAGALGVVLGIWRSEARSYDEFKAELDRVADYLATSRPTAVNLFWALDRMREAAERNKDKPIPELKKLLLKEALDIIEEDKRICRAIGRNGARLLPDECTVLTHCNAGGLATADYGTALGVIYAAVEMGKRIKVFADETRPLLQGARLTAWELMQGGIEVTLICDNTAAYVMKQGLVDCVIVGADRIAANGDTANKIGTYNLAVLAKEHGIPFYVAAPSSTFDLTLESGDQIPIEERSPEEVTCPFGRRIAPEGVKVYNPAFDVTPARLITAIITEKGVIRQPLHENIPKILNACP
ncbi:S-methyl-5-thioribose-1-phosphate isomerase [Candidatus Poribacteria bacterium]|nr:MAG: S-methyl-5-thioribose-1-phosphate isomerase [Candidatus Poribacteria bacterium]